MNIDRKIATAKRSEVAFSPEVRILLAPKALQLPALCG